MESNENWENEEGTLVNEWYDERANDWRCRIHFDYDDRLMQDLSMSDLLLAESHSEEENVVLSIIRKEQWDKNTHSLVKNIDDADPTQAEKLLTKTRAVFKTLTGQKTDDDKRIVVYAKKTTLGIKKNGDEYKVTPSYQMMIMGGTVRILKPKMLDKIFNANISKEKSFEAGELLGRKRVALRLDATMLVEQHSGVFGYTGTGKSNMVSCLIDGLYKLNKKPNVVVFDLVPEYSGLLVDLINENKNSMICFANQNSIPKKMKLFMEGSIDVAQAADEFVRHMLLPRDLNKKPVREFYQRIYEQVLSNKKVRFYSGKWKIKTLEQFNEFILGKFINIPRLEGSVAAECINLQRDRGSWAKGKNFTLENLILYKKWYKTQPHNRPHTWIMWEHDIGLIDEYIDRLEFNPESGYEINRDQLVDLLMDENGNNLIIFQGDDERSLQRLSKEIISERRGIYRRRANSGVMEPLTLFVFDEAHKFISSKRSGKLDLDSREAVEDIVMRGRKYGLGALISTQRMGQLDSNIISQLHTYFVSKLPRRDDQDKVVDGFGMGRDLLIETFKFHPGDWLVLSNNGTTGLSNSPIHIHSYDANRRIEQYFSSIVNG